MPDDVVQDQDTGDLNQEDPQEFFAEYRDLKPTGETPTPEPVKEEPAAEETKPETETSAETQAVEPEVPAAKKSRKAKVEPAVQPQVEQDPVVEIDGQKMKLSEYRKWREDAETWRNQAVHFQTKYTETLEQQRAFLAGREQALQQQPQQPQDQPQSETIEAWRGRIDPGVKMMVEMGVLDPETVEVSPDIARIVTALYAEAQEARNFKMAALQEYQQSIVPVVHAVQDERLQLHRQQVLGGIHEKIAAVPAQFGEYFAPLADPETRNKFIDYLQNVVNPQMSRFESEDVLDFLASQYVAMTRNALMGAAEEASRARSQVQPSRNAPQGESPATGGRTQREKPREPMPFGTMDPRELFSRG
jgi:hypothetical protein